MCCDSGVGIGTTANGFSLHATGPINFIGTCYASNFAGDGSQITNLNVDQTGWAPVTGGIYNSNLNNVGIGTSVPRFNLELGPIGSEDISLHVNGKSRFIGFVETNDIVGGSLTVTGTFDFANAKSETFKRLQSLLELQNLHNHSKSEVVQQKCLL